jgi:peroxiredoxin
LKPVKKQSSTGGFQMMSEKRQAIGMKWLVLSLFSGLMILTGGIHAGEVDAGGSDTAPQGKTTGTKIGKPAPYFSLKDSKGVTHTLSEYRDETVVLTWVNPACPFVVPHNKAKTIDRLGDSHQKDDVVFLQVDSSHNGSIERTRDTEDKFGIHTPTLHDFDGQVGRAYGAKRTPHSFIINGDGILVYQGAIDNAPLGDVRGDGEKINYLHAALDDMAAGKSPSTQSTKAYGCSVKYAR